MASPEESRGRDKYILLGTGVGHDEDGSYTVLVFVYENEDVAERNVGVFKKILAEGSSLITNEPWNEVFSKTEVWNDNRALLSKLRTEHPRIYLNLVVTMDSLIILWDNS